MGTTGRSARPFREKTVSAGAARGQGLRSSSPVNSRHSRESPSVSTAGFPPGASQQQPGQRRPRLHVPAAQRGRGHQACRSVQQSGRSQTQGLWSQVPQAHPPLGPGHTPPATITGQRGRRLSPLSTEHTPQGPRSYRAGLAVAWAHPFQALNPVVSRHSGSISRRLRGVAPKATSQSSPHRGQI